MNEASQAELLGIKMSDLLKESPDSLQQLKFRRAAMKKSEEYWAAMRGKIPPFSEWITLQHAAKHFSYSEENMRRWVKAGFVRAEKQNQRWMIDYRDLEAFIYDRVR